MVAAPSLLPPGVEIENVSSRPRPQRGARGDASVRIRTVRTKYSRITIDISTTCGYHNDGAIGSLEIRLRPVRSVFRVRFSAGGREFVRRRLTARALKTGKGRTIPRFPMRRFSLSAIRLYKPQASAVKSQASALNFRDATFLLGSGPNRRNHPPAKNLQATSRAT